MIGNYQSLTNCFNELEDAKELERLHKLGTTLHWIKKSNIKTGEVESIFGIFTKNHIHFYEYLSICINSTTEYTFEEIEFRGER
jgi:hypothetical protein